MHKPCTPRHNIASMLAGIYSRPEHRSQNPKQKRDGTRRAKKIIFGKNRKLKLRKRLFLKLFSGQITAWRNLAVFGAVDRNRPVPRAESFNINPDGLRVARWLFYFYCPSLTTVRRQTAGRPMNFPEITLCVLTRRRFVGPHPGPCPSEPLGDSDDRKKTPTKYT